MKLRSRPSVPIGKFGPDQDSEKGSAEPKELARNPYAGYEAGSKPWLRCDRGITIKTTHFSA